MGSSPRLPVRLARKQTLLAMVRGSVGSKAYRHLYVETASRRRDVTGAGDLSCAFFVSATLASLTLIDRIHGTVAGTEWAMRQAGWRRRRERRPRVGDVIVWEAREFPNGSHKHIGFFVGNGRAVSTSSRRKTVAIHDYRYVGSRPIESIYWNPKLNA